MGNSSSSSSSIPNSGPDKSNNDDDEVMGNNSSSSSSSIPNNSPAANKSNNNDDNKVICIDCDKKNQKDLPKNDPLSQKDQPCATFYETVSECMTKYEGQISSCTDEWDAFRKCHRQEQQQQRAARN